VTIHIDLSEHVALVTGGGRGVGRGIATRLLDAGAEVVICGRSEPASLPTATDGSGRVASFLAADVRDPDEVDALVAEVVARHGRLDVAVNNAGGSPNTEAATASPRSRSPSAPTPRCSSRRAAAPSSTSPA
jgi:NAD(P)-dependent dehydrogenase (short-subunit alcohol dehydrogenase family)